MSLALIGLSLLLMASLAVPLGVASAQRPGSWSDRLAGAASYALFSVPVFWAALLLQIAFAVKLGWLPLFGVESEGAEGFHRTARLLDRLRHLALPVLCLSYGGRAYLSRFVRSSVLETASTDALRAARARGRSALGTLWTHGMRRAAVPMLTLAGFLLPRLVGGSVVVEHVFGIPGVQELGPGAAPVCERKQRTMARHPGGCPAIPPLRRRCRRPSRSRALRERPGTACQGTPDGRRRPRANHRDPGTHPLDECHQGSFLPHLCVCRRSFGDLFLTRWRLHPLGAGAGLGGTLIRGIRTAESRCARRAAARLGYTPTISREHPAESSV